MSKPIARLVWHANYSLKRSLAAVTNAASNAMPTSNPNYSGQGSLNKNWIHPPDALIYGRVEYTVKFLGEVPVEQAKGTEIIKHAVQQLRFNLSVKKATGFKLQKVELHINVDGVNIVDAKTKMVLHKYPLHRISFCADDKTDKRLFAFIAKQQSSVPNSDGTCGSIDHAQRHNCYVFLSDKLAEEITLTIGEAFDLAYRRFLDNNGRDLELKKQLIVLRKRVSDLEMENAELKRQLAQQQRTISAASSKSTNSHQQASLVDLTTPAVPVQTQQQQQSTGKKWENFGESNLMSPALPTSPVPRSPPNSTMQLPPPTVAVAAAAVPRKQHRQGGSANVDIMQTLSINGPDVGRRLENLRLAELEDIFDQDFDPRAGEVVSERKNPFDKATNGEKKGSQISANVAGNTSAGTEPSSEDFEMAINMIDSRLAEMRDGFSSGISFGHDDFQTADFDPIQNNGTNASHGASGKTK